MIITPDGICVKSRAPCHSAVSTAGFFFDFVGNNVTILRLQCHAGSASPNDFVMTINIFNATAGTQMSNMAWISRGRQPEILDSAAQGRLFVAGKISKQPEILDSAAQGRLFVAGKISNDNYDPGKLEILIFEYASHRDQRFGCNVTKSNQGQTGEVSWIVAVNKTSPTKAVSTTPRATFTDAPYRVGAVKDKEGKQLIETDSLPMTVLIVMLVLISILLFLAVFLLLHRYRSRCQRREEDLYHPPAYCLAPDHHHHLPHLTPNIQDWPDNSTVALIKSGKGGGSRTLSARSHYSIAAHHHPGGHHVMPPLPPIPPPTPNGAGGPGGAGRRCKSEDRGEAYRRPPSTNSSVKVPYVQPQDAIGQESSEDGEVAAFSAGTPRVRYKSTRESPSRQNSPLYACVPVSSTDE
ncbi:hypothetical protein RRG08_062444 [Elysia crispata]|uniref:Uncharacterized protein n=1 Tax=Elysia crispata TaxID=231223 RepID=A0AAE0XP74_9GAST|nr:hypothetical protein RRG08_062444 [Elysia crispata]